MPRTERTAKKARETHGARAGLDDLAERAMDASAVRRSTSHPVRSRPRGRGGLRRLHVAALCVLAFGVVAALTAAHWDPPPPDRIWIADADRRSRTLEVRSDGGGATLAGALRGPPHVPGERLDGEVRAIWPLTGCVGQGDYGVARAVDVTRPSVRRRVGAWFGAAAQRPVRYCRSGLTRQIGATSWRAFDRRVATVLHEGSGTTVRAFELLAGGATACGAAWERRETDEGDRLVVTEFVARRARQVTWQYAVSADGRQLRALGPRGFGIRGRLDGNLPR